MFRRRCIGNSIEIDSNNKNNNLFIVNSQSMSNPFAKKETWFIPTFTLTLHFLSIKAFIHFMGFKFN